MDARLLRAALIAASFLSIAASYRTENFLVTAPTPDFAQEVCVTAEELRKNLAVEWLGTELPAWREPCPISVQVGPHLGAGGATSFMFDNGRPFGWTMSIQGSRERLLDSVLPHEITHTIFATHFGRPLPRWADEGACTTVEDVSERRKQDQLLIQFLTTDRGIAFNRMFAMTEYPPDILPLYSQGYSLAKFLILQGGKRKFIEYVGSGMRGNNWTASTRKHYGYQSLSELQTKWVSWVGKGSPADLKQPYLGSVAQSSAEPERLAVAGSNPSGPGRTPPLRGESETQPLDDLEPIDLVNPVALVSHEELSGKSDTATEGTAELPASGWYRRQRDLAYRRRNADAPPSQQSDHETGPRDLATQPHTQPRTLSRPQPLGRPQQLILEWSRSPSQPTPAAATISPGGFALPWRR